MVSDQLPLEGDRDGTTLDPAIDRDRLNAQHVRVWTVMRDGHWWTLAQVARITGDPEGSVSARMRDFRKEKFGAHQLVRRRVPTGRYEYALRWQALLVPTAKQVVSAWQGRQRVCVSTLRAPHGQIAPKHRRSCGYGQ